MTDEIAPFCVKDVSWLELEAAYWDSPAGNCPGCAEGARADLAAADAAGADLDGILEGTGAKIVFVNGDTCIILPNEAALVAFVGWCQENVEWD